MSYYNEYLCDVRQWMAAGDHGATGICVTRPVEEDTRPEHVNAIYLSMAAWPALAPPSSTGRVTSSPAPVSIPSYSSNSTGTSFPVTSSRTCWRRRQLPRNKLATMVARKLATRQTILTCRDGGKVVSFLVTSS